MNTERDKFLTEAIGECWHEHTMTCGYNLTRTGEYVSDIKSTSYPNDFSSWNGFGKLWEWVSRQESMMCGLASRYNGEQAKIKLIYISPDTFADAVYNYLKEQQQ